MHEKGRVFKGMMGGAAYDRWASALGMGAPFYRRAVGEIDLSGGSRVLDLGCGTGSLSVALADKLDGAALIYGVDISDEQLDYARKKNERSPMRIPIESYAKKGALFLEKIGTSIL